MRLGFPPILVASLVAWAAPPPVLAQGPEVGGIDHVLGDSAASVIVVEFGDFACSACGLFWRTTWPQVRADLIDTGRVAWRHVPFLLGFRNGDRAANAAECAAEQGGFWPMHDRLFGGQSEWMGIRRPHEVFDRYAEEIGLDREAYRNCYEDEDGEARTKAANRVAREARVRVTPTFFINGRAAFGALPYESFLELVEEAERRGAGEGDPS